MSLSIILFVFITSVILISSVGWLVWGRCREASRQKYVRRRERQNVTVGGQPATPLETFRSEVLVVEVLGHFLQVLHVGSVGSWKRNATRLARINNVKNWSHLPRVVDEGLQSIIFYWLGLRLKQIYWSLRAASDIPCHSHQHCPQLQEVIMLWVLHLHNSPGVQTAPHLLPLGLDLLVGSHHCKWDTGLKKMV